MPIRKNDGLPSRQAPGNIEDVRSNLAVAVEKCSSAVALLIIDRRAALIAAVRSMLGREHSRDFTVAVVTTC